MIKAERARIPGEATGRIGHSLEDLVVLDHPVIAALDVDICEALSEVWILFVQGFCNKVPRQWAEPLCGSIKVVLAGGYLLQLNYTRELRARFPPVVV